eukprot:COSAG06_NODE_2284_length_7174_cov_5.515336_2_plen_81_part_00
MAFFEISLCLSRACLGKKLHFIYKWLKKPVFSQVSGSVHALLSKCEDRCDEHHAYLPQLRGALSSQRLHPPVSYRTLKTD